MTAPLLRLLVGTGTDLLGDAHSIMVRRGLKADGVTDDLDPGVFTATIKGGDEVNPLTNPDVRPDQPLVLEAGIEDDYSTDVTWHPLFTGTLTRAVIEYDDTAKGDPAAYRVTITATDSVAALAATPSEVAVSGTLAQRVAAVLDPTGIAYAVTDLDPAGASTTLTTDGKTAADQLRLIRDTLHASVYVDRAGVVRAVADNARPRTITTPDHVATDTIDGEPDGAIHYTAITPAFDTDAVVNVLTIKHPAGEATYTDEDSRAAWGDQPQTVTVNDGLPETHAGLYLATRTDPDLIPEEISFPVDHPDYGTQHLAAACALEVGDSVHVVRDGLADHTLIVRDITHTITPTLWTVGLGLRVPEVLATRWDDVPANLTWDDLPAGLTWDDAVTWHPYQGA